MSLRNTLTLRTLWSDDPAPSSVFCNSSRTCCVCCSMVPLKCAPTPERNNRLPYETAGENRGRWELEGVPLAGYAFFSICPVPWASALPVRIAPPVHAARSAAALFRIPLLVDGTSMLSVLL